MFRVCTDLSVVWCRLWNSGERSPRDWVVLVKNRFMEVRLELVLEDMWGKESRYDTTRQGEQHEVREIGGTTSGGL